MPGDDTERILTLVAHSGGSNNYQIWLEILKIRWFSLYGLYHQSLELWMDLGGFYLDFLSKKGLQHAESLFSTKIIIINHSDAFTMIQQWYICMRSSKNIEKYWKIRKMYNFRSGLLTNLGPHCNSSMVPRPRLRTSGFTFKGIFTRSAE